MIAVNYRLFIISVSAVVKNVVPVVKKVVTLVIE
tara:strand:+ start:3083 stop:3184 length:102 start_codon:yes stop_codon:yes gene_type:complete